MRLFPKFSSKSNLTKREAKTISGSYHKKKNLHNGSKESADISSKAFYIPKSVYNCNHLFGYVIN